MNKVGRQKLILFQYIDNNRRECTDQMWVTHFDLKQGAGGFLSTGVNQEKSTGGQRKLNGGRSVGYC